MAGARAQATRAIPVAPKPTDFLLTGRSFRKWDDDNSVTTCRVCMDETGLVLEVISEGREGIAVLMSEVSDIRTGRYARQPKDAKLVESLLAGSEDAVDELCLTIVYGTNMVDVTFLNLVASSAKEVEEWACDFQKLIHNTIGHNQGEDVFLKREFARLRATRVKEKGIMVSKVQDAFGAKAKKEEVKDGMGAVGWPVGKSDFISTEEFTFEKFCTFHDRVLRADYYDDAFSKVGSSGKKPIINAAQLCKFLNESHRDPRLNEILFPYTKEEDAKAMVSKFEPNESLSSKSQMTVQGLTNYLRSSDNLVIHPSRFTHFQDLDQPLCSYFICSSHNTYLTGHQITGKATVEIYRQVLLSGCRCIELDCWDGNLGEPVITHGKTLVNDIPFKEVIEAINESAFKTTDYPVILSFENHCRYRQQRKMTVHLRQILGDKLLDKPLDKYPIQPGRPLPPPSALRGKIIVKNKKVVPKVEGEAEGVAPAAEEDVAAMNSASALPSGGDQVDTSSLNMSNVSGSLDSRAASPITENVRQSAPFSEASTIKAGEEGTALAAGPAGGWSDQDMASLVNYCEPIRFKSFEDSEESNQHQQMSSYAEVQATKCVVEQPSEFVQYNNRQMSRIYPKASRIDSTNYQPQLYWNVGCQMVALNFQTLDIPMQLNCGKFEYNGLCGYLLKPEVYRRTDKPFYPFVESPIDGVVAATVSVKIIAGQFLTPLRTNVSVEVDMFGLPTDTVRRRYKTKAVPNDACVVWNADPFLFKKVVLADLAMLRVSVVDSQGVTLGMRILPLDGLEPGYRFIHLRNEFNQPLPLASIFAFIVIKMYIPDSMTQFADWLQDPIKYQSEIDKRSKQLQDLVEPGGDEDASDEKKGDKAVTTPTGPSKGEMPRSDSAAFTLAGLGMIDKRPSTMEKDKKVDGTLEREKRLDGIDTIEKERRLVDPTGTLARKSKLQQESRFNRPTFKVDSLERHYETSKDYRRLASKLEKEVEVVRKKYQKPLVKMQSAEKKLAQQQQKVLAAAGKKPGTDISSMKEAQEKELSSLQQRHREDLSLLAQKLIGEEESLVMKLLPGVFAGFVRNVVSAHASGLKQLQHLQKQVRADYEKQQSKETAIESIKYRDQRKEDVTNKEELERIMSEFARKLVERDVAIRFQFEEQLKKQETEVQSEQDHVLKLAKLEEEKFTEQIKQFYVKQRDFIADPDIAPDRFFLLESIRQDFGLLYGSR